MSGLTVRLAQAHPIRLAVEFACDSGELVALVGPSGSGKTTILKAIAGLVDTRSGRIQAGGVDWLDTDHGLFLPPQARRVGLVFQSYALFPHLSALDNVAIAARGDGARERARDLLARVNLAGLEGRRPGTLSGGQQQRVALARALARDPAVLLLDEPFSAVDQATRQTLYRELAELRRSLSLPIVLVTHDLFEARMLADRMVILDHGETMQNGTPGHVLSRPRNARVAKLLGIQNHFSGVFRSAPDGESWGALHWGEKGEGVRLRTLDKRRLPDGQRVTWVIAGEYLMLQAAADDRADTFACRLEDVLPLGEMTQCKVRVVAAPGDRVIMNVPTRFLVDHRLAVGMSVWMHLDVAGIHIMPTRDPNSPRTRHARVGHSG
ncbi:MAG: ABC transporter ATP-binding protein [Burkholderiales bacterium]